MSLQIDIKLFNDQSYKVANGTYYNVQTDNRIIEVLERCRMSGRRIRLDYGDVETGRSWGEDNDVTGKLGRSMGPVKVPILLHNARSTGGPQLLDQCLVAIMDTHGRTLYRHPSYQPSHDWENARIRPGEKYAELFARHTQSSREELVARFITRAHAQRYIDKKIKFEPMPGCKHCGSSLSR